MADSNCELFEFVACTVLLGLLCLFGLLGNGTAFLVLRKHPTETSTIAVLQALAVADSLLLICALLLYCVPGIHSYFDSLDTLYIYWGRSKEFVWPLAMITHTCAVWLTVMVTATRYLSVCRPLGSKKNACLHDPKIQILIVVMFSVFYNIPRFFEHQQIGTKETNVVINASEEERVNVSNTNVNDHKLEPIHLGDNRLYQIIYSNILYYPVMFIIPLVSLTYFNAKLIQTIRQIKKKRETMTGHRSRDDHITICIIAIVCVFIICQTPALINQIFWAIRSPECGSFHFYYTKISDVLVVLNSSCNFIIYCLFGQSFRKIFFETVCITKINPKPFISVTNDRCNIPLIEICEACKSELKSETKCSDKLKPPCSCKMPSEAGLNGDVSNDAATLMTRATSASLSEKQNSPQNSP